MSSQPPPADDHVGSVDLRDEAVHWNLGESQSYGEYLHLELLLNAQRPLTTEHSEMLFIIVHQVSELWMRLLRHELEGVVECVRRDELDPSFKMFDRIARIQAQLLAVWEVLSTMTPFDYSAFRNALGRSSGFQSQQYRLLEFMLGNKHAEMIEVHRGEPQVYAEFKRVLAAGIWRGARGAGARLLATLPGQQAGDRGVAGCLSQCGKGLGSIRAGRASGRSGLSIPAVALPAHENRRAHHRLQAGHRRYCRGVLSGQGPAPQVVP